MAANNPESVHLLVISRQVNVLTSFWELVEANSWIVQVATSGWHALEVVRSEQGPDLVLFDLLAGDPDALPVLRWLRRIRPSVPVLVLTPIDDTLQRAEATRLGAQEYLLKPIQARELELAIKRHLVSFEHPELTDEGIERIDDERFFAASTPMMQKLRAQVQLLAQVNVPILITGEAGSGKETVARLLHKLSPRSEFLFRKVDCAETKEHLLAELFGPEHGLSDGASMTGKLELCRQGTLLLSNVTEMPAEIQARLQAVLQQQRANSLHTHGPDVNARIIASTDRDADFILKQKKFREDLYYSLSTFAMYVPPLRQRKTEVPFLLGHFLQQMSSYYSLPARTLSAAASAACQQHSWAGNLAELEAFAKRYLVVGDDSLDELEPMPRLVTKQSFRFSGHDSHDQNMLPDGPEHLDNESLSSLVRSVKGETEKNAIAGALKKTQWNRKAAATLLQISYRALLYKIQQYQITPLDTAVGADMAFRAAGLRSPEN